jgi:hypothetical protein
MTAMRALIVALWIGFVVICAYWGLWFFGGRSMLASLDTQAYIVFENAFPLADGWLALTYAGSALALQRRKPTALFWLLCAGSGSFYLAGMDILFDLQNAVYTGGDIGAAITEIIINLASLGLGAWTLTYGWRHRVELLGSRA